MSTRRRQQLSAFIQQKRRTDNRGARRRSTLALAPRDPSQHFSPQRHGLSPEQCRLANQLLRRAEQERPLHGTPEQQRFRFALRCGGIISAVKRNLVGNSRFGHHLMGYRGGRVMRLHGLHILREIAPIGHLAAQIAREKRVAQEYWETTGEVLPIGSRPAPSQEQQYINDLITAWEAQQWQQTDRFSW